MDVKSAFLNGDLTEEVYVEQPLSYEKKGEEEKVYKFKKALCGLKQARRAWNSKLDRRLVSLGFKRCPLKDRKDSLPNNEEQVKVEDATQKECWHQAVDKPTVKWMTRLLQETAKAMPTITPVRSGNRVWDPGRNEDVVLRGVNVRVKHDLTCTARA